MLPDQAVAATCGGTGEALLAVILSGDFMSPMVYCNGLCFQYVLSFARRKKASPGPLFSRSSQLR
jgi:hypothetical protein